MCMKQPMKSGANLAPAPAFNPARSGATPQQRPFYCGIAIHNRAFESGTTAGAPQVHEV